jgi:pyridoxamine 5'-phosphate oxidase
MTIMSKKEILEVLNANPVCSFATTEGKKPHVRGMAMIKADEKGLIFQSWTLKDVHQQIMKNPEVELCFNTKDGKQIRISGRAEIVDDMALKQEVVALRPFMKPIIDEKGWDVVAIYRIGGKASIWERKDNFTPKTYVNI